MLVTELVKKINFNDSCVNEVVYKSGTVLLNIDLCMWKQKEYQEGEPELQNTIIKFLNVLNYYWDSEKKEEDIDYDSIIDITYEKDKVKIILEDEDISVLSFNCREVLIE